MDPEHWFQAVLAELSGAERYALRQMEEQEQDWARGQMQLAEAEIQARQEEFDVDKLDELTQVCLVFYCVTGTRKLYAFFAATDV
jgi:hypothetical protein